MELIETGNSNYSKVSLERYRSSSNKIFEILQSNCTILQKASIDEAYCDITAEVNKILKQKQSENKTALIQDLIDDKNGWNGKVLPLISDIDDNFSTEAKTIGDVKLLIGSNIIQKIREEIFEKLGYTCSAGIAHNKTFAKLTASYNKPNGQTIVREGAVERLLNEINLSDIPGLGKKINNQLCLLNITTPIQLQNLSMNKLIENFGEKTAQWLHQICRGIDQKPVESSVIVKSIMAAKRFSPIYNLKDLENIINVLCVDLVQRIKVDHDVHQRIPQTLTIQFHSLQQGNTLSIPMPTQWNVAVHLFNCIKRTLEFKLDGRTLFPCTRLAFQVSNFLSTKGTSSISNYFSVQKKNDLQVESSIKSTSIKLPIDITPIISTSQLNFDESIEYFKCSECGKLIQISNRGEHNDYHFALKVSSEVNIDEENSKTSAISLKPPTLTKPNKKLEKSKTIKKPPRKPKPKKQPTLKKFLSPKK